jgi:transposase-like protein
VTLRQEIYELVSGATMSYRQIAQQLGISSTHTVARLYNEAVKDGMTAEIRDAEIARLEAWHEKLEEAAELVLAGDKPEMMAGLAKSAAEISKQRRLILGIDVPITSKLQLTPGGQDAEPPTPEMAQWLEKFRNSPLYKETE